MASLNNSVQNTKNFVKYLLITAVVLIIGQIVYSAFIAPIFNATLTTIEKPTNGYGILPKLDIPNLEPNYNLSKSGEQLTFDLSNTKGIFYVEDFLTGKIFGKVQGENAEIQIARVYKYIQKNYDKLDLNNEIITKAKSIGFIGSFEDLGNSLRFISVDTTRAMVINKYHENIEITSDIAKIPNFASVKKFDAAYSTYGPTLKGKYLSSGLLNDVYKGSVTQVQQVKYDTLNSRYEEAESTDRTELLRVDAFKTAQLNTIQVPEDADDTTKAKLLPKVFTGKVYTLDPKRGSATMITGNFDTQLYFANVNNLQIFKGVYETYQLKTIAEAWEELKKGSASLRYLKRYANIYNYDYPYQSELVKKYTVQNIQLGYLETTFDQGYLMPIYIFSGIATLEPDTTSTGDVYAEFVFYLPALQQ